MSDDDDNYDPADDDAVLDCFGCGQPAMMEYQGQHYCGNNEDCKVAIDCFNVDVANLNALRETPYQDHDSHNDDLF